MAASGDWSQIRSLRKGIRPAQGRLKDLAGELVSSEQRAQTMAEYLERVQRAIRPVAAAPQRAPPGPELPTDVGPIQAEEVTKAASQMKSNRACGDDGVPAEFWDAVLKVGRPGADWLVEFCRQCWTSSRIRMPNEAHCEGGINLQEGRWGRMC